MASHRVLGEKPARGSLRPLKSTTVYPWHIGLIDNPGANPGRGHVDQEVVKPRKDKKLGGDRPK